MPVRKTKFGTKVQSFSQTDKLKVLFLSKFVIFICPLRHTIQMHRKQSEKCAYCRTDCSTDCTQTTLPKKPFSVVAKGRLLREDSEWIAGG